MTDPLARGYAVYLRLERGYSENTIESYLHDVGLLAEFAAQKGKNIMDLSEADLHEFMEEYGVDESEIKHVW